MQLGDYDKLITQVYIGVPLNLQCKEFPKHLLTFESIVCLTCFLSSDFIVYQIHRLILDFTSYPCVYRYLCQYIDVLSK